MSSGGGRAPKGPSTSKASAAARPSVDIRSSMKSKPQQQPPQQQSGAAQQTYDPSWQYRLTAIGEMCKGLQVEIPVSTTTRCFTIGRSSSSDNHQQAGDPYKLPLKIPATENSISRKQGQAMLRVEGSRWLLKNLGTMTDIQINRRPSALGERSTCVVLKADQEAEIRVGDAVALDMWHNPCECLWRLDVSTPGPVRDVRLASPASSSTTISFSSESSSGGSGKAKPTPAEQKLPGSVSAGVDMSAIRADVKAAGPENNCGSRTDSNKGMTSSSTPAKHPVPHSSRGRHPPRPSPSPHHAPNPKIPTASAVSGRSALQATPVAAAVLHRAGSQSAGAVPAAAQSSPFVDLSQSDDDDDEVRVTGVKPSPAAAPQEEHMDVIEISDEDDPVQEVAPPVVQRTDTSARAPSAPAPLSVATLASEPAPPPRPPVVRGPSQEHSQSSQQQQIEEGLSKRKEEGGLWWALQSEAEPKSLGVVARLDNEKENMRPHSGTDDAAATGAVQSALKEGDYVSVAGRFDPGFNTPAGDGRITAVHHEEDGQLSYDVRYLILQSTGRRLPAWQLTRKDPTASMPRRERKPSKRLSEAGGAEETEEEGEQHARKRSKNVPAGKGVFGINVQSEMTTTYHLVVKEEVSRELSAAPRRVSRVSSSNKDTAAIDDADAELNGPLDGRKRGSSRLPISDVLLSDEEGGAEARGDEPVKCQHCGRRFTLKSEKDKAKWEDHLSEHRRMAMKQKKEERARKGQMFQEIPSSVAFCLQASLNMQDPSCLVSILREWVGMHGRVPPLSTYEHMLKALQQAQCPLRARAFHGMLMFTQRQLPPHKVPTCWRPDNPVMFMDMIEKADYTVSSFVAPRVLRSLALVLQYLSTIFEEELLSLHMAASLRRVPISLGDSILGQLLFTPKAGSTKTGKGRMPEQKLKDLIVRAANAAANVRVRPGSKTRAFAMLTDDSPLPRDRADWLLLCEELEVLGTRALTRLLASALEVYEECRGLDSRDASSELTYRLGQMASSRKDQDAVTITLFRHFPLRMRGFVQEYKEYEMGTLKVLGLFDDIAAVEGL